MSRIGKLPVAITAGVTVTVVGADVSVKGPNGELAWSLPAGISAAVEGDEVVVKRDSDRVKNFHGLSRSLIANMIEGCAKGYTKQLEIHGVGFRAAVTGQMLSLSLGFASPKEYKIPEDITIVVAKNTDLTVTGADKQKVGEAAARIRSYYPAEPYKGKGVRYKGEQVRRKEGKTVS
jgi:large subunit ribosomal protein L6